jgi:hypothetical protein
MRHKVPVQARAALRASPATVVCPRFPYSSVHASSNASRGLRGITFDASP